MLSQGNSALFFYLLIQTVVIKMKFYNRNTIGNPIFCQEDFWLIQLTWSGVADMILCPFEKG
jgi:hypothetical protein